MATQISGQEVWEKFADNLQIKIGDAILVRGATEMREGVQKFSDVLTKAKQNINIARTVSFTDGGDTIYLAPIGSASVPNQNEIESKAKNPGFIIALMVVTNNSSLALGQPTIYAERIRLKDDNKTWFSELLDPSGKAVQVISAMKGSAPPNVSIPSSAINRGTTYCTTWFLGFYGWCRPCRGGTDLTECTKALSMAAHVTST